ncbi:M1 family aminopeptidase [Marinoscillum sp.]|uniref:M1 family aminopeptidase n=1 Tax=Marinoscillum sp. TaxID=2024838 RepID=UPI003BAA55A7
MNRLFISVLVFVGQLSIYAFGQTLYDLKHVEINLSATNTSTYIDGYARFSFTLNQIGQTIDLHLVDELAVSKVLINGVEATFQHSENQLSIDYTNPDFNLLQTVTVHYAGDPNPNGQNSNGIFNDFSNAWGNQITWTLSEPFYARYWWPSKEELTDKFDSVNVTITTENHLKVGSNGRLVKLTQIDNNKIKYEWESHYPIAYYLIAFTVGEYVEYNNFAYPGALNGDSVLIQNYIYNNPETLEFYQDQLDEIPKMLELFSDYFGIYPFYEEKYGHVMAPFGGGMEHQTMSTMGIFTFGLNAHELGHQWFGDHVTCGSWSDIWINEGFARFCEYFATEKLLSTNNYYAVVKDDILSVTGTPDGSVYIPGSGATDDSRIFNFRLTYAKGGLLVNMIRHLVNDDELFFEAVRTYLDEFGNKTARGEDFQRTMERETGLDFSDFFNQWYYGEGHPEYDIQWRKDNNDTINLEISQKPTASTALFTTPMEFRITFQSGLTKLFRVTPSQLTETFRIGANGNVAKLEFDPKSWLVKRVLNFNQVDQNGNPILSEGTEDNVLFWPNPITNTIYFGDELSDIRIYDLQGKVVTKSLEVSKSLDLGYLKRGTYLLSGKKNELPVSIKFIKE